MSNLLMKVRILPLTIFVAFLLLTVKLGDIWQGVDEAARADRPGPSFGISGAEAGTARAQTAPVQLAQAAPPEAAPTQTQPAGDTADQALAAFAQDPTLFTQSEIDLLQKLAERREVLDQRARELDMREGLLTAAETRINKRIDDLKQLQLTIEGLIQTHDAQQDAQLLSLVKIYENMKPADAARIFEELDMDTLLLVAERMPERKLAPIMAKLNPAKAKEMTTELARQRQLPLPVSPAGMGG